MSFANWRNPCQVTHKVNCKWFIQRLDILHSETLVIWRASQVLSVIDYQRHMHVCALATNMQVYIKLVKTQRETHVQVSSLSWAVLYEIAVPMRLNMQQYTTQNICCSCAHDTKLQCPWHKACSNTQYTIYKATVSLAQKAAVSTAQSLWYYTAYKIWSGSAHSIKHVAVHSIQYMKTQICSSTELKQPAYCPQTFCHSTQHTYVA